MTKHKKININGIELFEVKYTEEIYICTIENVGTDEYYAYTDKGEGYAIAKLNTINIVELMVTGEIEWSNMHIKPITVYS